MNHDENSSSNCSAKVNKPVRPMFRSERTRPTGSEAICRNSLYAPTAADALYASPHKANNFPRRRRKRARWRESSGGSVHLNLAERRRGASAPSRATPDTVDRLVCASARTSVRKTVIIHSRLGRGASRPDVILMDINLPGISGIQALKILRADPATAHIPVVAISANAMPRDIEKGLEAGFFNYFTKPIKVHQFMGALDVALKCEKTESARSNKEKKHDGSCIQHS